MARLGPPSPGQHEDTRGIGTGTYGFVVTFEESTRLAGVVVIVPARDTQGTAARSACLCIGGRAIRCCWSWSLCSGEEGDKCMLLLYEKGPCARGIHRPKANLFGTAVAQHVS
eukprot:281907-Chlamydomonas_euryale.AAC.2